MRFERESKKPIDNVSEKQLRRQLSFKSSWADTTFAILDAGNGDYVQMLGGGVGCCIEWRDARTGRHYRGSQQPPKVHWKHRTQRDRLWLEPEEFFIIDQVIEAFVAYLHGRPMPEYIIWRDITDEVQQQIAASG